MRSSDRIERFQRRVRERGADAAVLSVGPDTLYLAGVFGEPLDRHAVLVVPAERDPFFVASAKAAYGIERESPIDVVSELRENDPAVVARRAAAELAAPDPVLLGSDLPHAVAGPLRQSLGDVSFGDAGPLLATLRIRKDDEEIAALRRAATVTDAVSEHLRSLGTELVGETESAIAGEIRSRLHARGGTRCSFPPVVAAGPNAAEPFHRSGEREIRAGDPVILDFGAFVDGYASDQTRTLVVGGEPPRGFERRHEAVRDALDRGVDAVEPGRTAGAVHRAVEQALAEHGVADEFPHGTGHGVGVEAHEPPSIAPGNDRKLEPGMVFSVEPGCYVECEYGVRIEDLVVVTGDGAERLNDSPRGWEP